MMEPYEVASILNDTIFKRFYLKQEAKDSYVDSLENYCNREDVFRKCCLDLKESQRTLPSILEIKLLYKDRMKYVNKINYAKLFHLTEDEKTNAKEGHKRFLEIKKACKDKSYNQACYDLGYFEFMNKELEKPEFTNPEFGEDMFDNLCTTLSKDCKK